MMDIECGEKLFFHWKLLHSEAGGLATERPWAVVLFSVGRWSSLPKRLSLLVCPYSFEYQILCTSAVQ